MALVCGIACVLGHVYPIYYGFKGGKGAGTLVGVLIGLYPFGLLVAFFMWMIILILTGYVGLSTMVAGVCFPVVVYYYFPGGLSTPIGIFASIMSIFLIFTLIRERKLDLIIYDLSQPSVIISLLLSVMVKL